MEILESYNIIFNKSQVPKIKEKKAQAYKEIHQKYILQIGRDLTEKQLKKKIQNMKTELKKKTDKTATGNKKIVLNAYEKQLLALMEGQENTVFQKLPGRRTKLQREIRKTDKTATGNKKIVLNAYEKQLLALMEGQENTVFQKLPGALSIGSVMEQPQPSTSKTEELIPPPPHVRPLPDKSPVTRRTKFKETPKISPFC
ncbi:Myb/SANT-like DNA-binding domain [Popillia japonica]|uniref:Regulatory protein zeste n=1 Tax=Popillia japonica TaxID=7064 RepID=A0AAW1L7Z0_POPJA